MKKYLPGILFVLPSVVLFCIFTIYPTFASISLGFFRAEIRYREFIGFGNFAYLIRNEEFWIAIWNTLKYIAFGVPPIVLIPLGISILAYRLSKPIQSFIRFAFYLPHLAAGVVISIVWRWIFNPLYGLANYLLELVGAEPLLWLADPTWAFVAICIVLISSGIGVNLLLYMASLDMVHNGSNDHARCWICIY
jgi:multiple sugar transport system permease protein